MNLHPTSLYLTTLLCLLWLSRDFPTRYHAHLTHYSTTLHVFLSAQQQLQFPLHSLISLSVVPTDPSHTHMALHQNPCTPLNVSAHPHHSILHCSLIPTYLSSIGLLRSQKTAPATSGLFTGVPTAWRCVMRQAPSQPPSLARQAGRGDE